MTMVRYEESPGRRGKGTPPTPPVTAMPPPPRPEAAPGVTHTWVMVRAGTGHRHASAEGREQFYGPGRHFVPVDVARMIAAQECRVAAEDAAFRDPTPVARLITGRGPAQRVAPDELDVMLGRA